MGLDYDKMEFEYKDPWPDDPDDDHSSVVWSVRRRYFVGRPVWYGILPFGTPNFVLFMVREGFRFLYCVVSRSAVVWYHTIL
jgi:hypothetical protein